MTFASFFEEHFLRTVNVSTVTVMSYIVNN